MPLFHPFLLPQIPYSAKPLNCPAFSRRTLQWPHSPSPDLISRRHHRLSSKMKDGIHLTNRPYGTGMQAGRHGCKGLPCADRSEEHTSELQSRGHLVCRLLLEKKNTMPTTRKS